MIRIALLPLLLVAMPAFGQERPMMITSDTPEYCEQLQARVAQFGFGDPDVQRLVTEGKRMCDHGEIRGGIARMRRALMMQLKQGRRQQMPPWPDLPPRRRR
jgi:hypothetical protein